MLNRVESITGRGLRSSVMGSSVIGNSKLMTESSLPVSQETQQQQETLEAAGKTTMLVAVAGRIRWDVIALARYACGLMCRRRWPRSTAGACGKP